MYENVEDDKLQACTIYNRPQMGDIDDDDDEAKQSETPGADSTAARFGRRLLPRRPLAALDLLPVASVFAPCRRA